MSDSNAQNETRSCLDDFDFSRTSDERRFRVMLNSLPTRDERDVIRFRTCLENDRRTPKEVAEIFKTTSERVLEIEDEFAKKLEEASVPKKGN
jgi:DNA-directed RNA polymerase sigma subunit (sigma70/sigma32)